MTGRPVKFGQSCNELEVGIVAMEAFDTYQTPLSRFGTNQLSISNLTFTISRYASKEMAHLFSPAVRAITLQIAEESTLMYLISIE